MSIAQRIEYIEGMFFFGSENNLNAFHGIIKEPIFFSRVLTKDELGEHYSAMKGPGINNKSLYSALCEKKDYMNST